MGVDVPNHSERPAPSLRTAHHAGYHLQLFVERALDKSDQRLLRLMTKRVGVALRGQKENGLVRGDQGPGQYMLWEIAKD